MGSGASKLEILERWKPSEFSRENMWMRTRLLASYQADMTALRRFGHHALLASLLYYLEHFCEPRCGLDEKDALAGVMHVPS